ncbi:MAG TPA: hypothetical protein EYN79_08235 [Planctomycetes bacterium]|nr:hypothetical protein [Planctomycetota bacterium]
MMTVPMRPDPMRTVAEMRLLPVLTLLSSIFFCTPLAAQPSEGFVLVAGRVHTPAGVLEDATIVIRDGKVVAVGTDIEAPLDLQVLRFPDGVVTAGLVAAAGDLISPRTGKESVSADYLAVDAFDRYGDFRQLLASGVTTVHLSPGTHRLLSGQGAVVKVAGTPQERILRSRSDLSIALTDTVDNPAPLLEIPFPASADTPILPPTRQRPTSRIGRLLALGEELDRALADDPSAGRDRHLDALAVAWNSGLPLRIVADHAADLIAGVSLLRGRDRRGYLVGVADLVEVRESLATASVPLVVRPRRGGGDIGFSLDRLPEGVPDLSVDYPGLVALGPPAASGPGALRWSAVLAASHFDDPNRTIEMMTSVPAEILGVADRVGSISPGKDADLVVWTDEPWKLVAQPREVFVSGRLAWRDDASSATIVRARTIWIGPDERITDGEILVENGRITAVGHSVPHPPRARVIDASRDGFVTPGFIDANGHLGLRGDQTSVGTTDRLTNALGVPDVQEAMVASSGVTTVLLTPHRISRGATTSAAIKTMGQARSDRVLRDVAAVVFEVSGHPKSLMGGVESLLGKGRKYIESWKKYEKALEEYENISRYL